MDEGLSVLQTKSELFAARERLYLKGHPHPVSSREVPASPALAARVRPATELNDRSHTARACCARVAKVRASWGRDTYTGLSATGLWRFLRRKTDAYGRSAAPSATSVVGPTGFLTIYWGGL